MICPDLPLPQELKVVAYLPAGRIIHPKFVFFIFTEASAQPVLVAKIPSNMDYASSLKSAFEILKEFFKSPRLKDLAPSVPKPIYEGKLQDLPLFLESYCFGRILPFKGYLSRYTPYKCFTSAAEWIKRFHVNTKEETRGEEEIHRLFITLIETTTQAFPELQERLKPLQEECLALADKSIPVVYSHGDYTAKNILFGKDAEDVKIIDWERHQKRDLPLFDLIKLSLWFICGRKGVSLSEGLKDCFLNDRRIKAVIKDYLAGMAIEKDLKRLLIPLYLVKRIGAIQKNRGKEAAQGHLECLYEWLKLEK